MKSTSPKSRSKRKVTPTGGKLMMIKGTLSPKKNRAGLLQSTIESYKANQFSSNRSAYKRNLTPSRTRTGNRATISNHNPHVKKNGPISATNLYENTNSGTGKNQNLRLNDRSSSKFITLTDKQSIE